MQAIFAPRSGAAIVVAAALLCAATSSGAWADEAAAPAAETVETIPVADAPARAEPARASNKQEAATRLEDVVVTATKREESTRKIAGTVNVLTGEELEQSGARELLDYLRYVPGVAMQEGLTNNQRTLSVRGITPGNGANTTVGVLINDVAMGDP